MAVAVSVPVPVLRPLYTSDAADDLPCVDLGGRRICTEKTDDVAEEEAH